MMNQKKKRFIIFLLILIVTEYRIYVKSIYYITNMYMTYKKKSLKQKLCSDRIFFEIINRRKKL